MRQNLVTCICLFNITFCAGFSAQSQDGSDSINKKKNITAEFEFSGDFTAKIQFNGALNTLLKGDISPPPVQPCEVSAQFKDVVMPVKDAHGKKEKHLQIYFTFECTRDGQKITTKLSPEYVRLSDLRALSSRIYISKELKSSQFKVTNLQY